VKALIVTRAGGGLAARRRLEATVPIGRLGRPEEVASFAAWLLLEGPEFLTGAIPLDGAQTTG
jgi:NAD(P)-dependent dehydrogenase (short-subunit alcohol dehydrogenase family)